MNKIIYFTNKDTGQILTIDRFLKEIAKWDDIGEVWTINDIDLSEVIYGKVNANIKFINANYTRIKTIEMKYYPNWNFTMKKREGED